MIRKFKRIDIRLLNKKVTTSVFCGLISGTQSIHSCGYMLSNVRKSKTNVNKIVRYERKGVIAVE